MAGGGSHEIYVTITDNNGCYDKKSIIIDVLCIEKPRIFGESEYCYNSNFWFPGNNISLYTESFYNTYQWYKNGVVMWGAYSMWDYQVGVGIYDYMVEVLDDNGCTVFSEPFTLNIHDVPNIVSVSTNIHPCPNEEIILSHNGNQNDVDYYWNTLPQQTINEFGCKSTSNSIIIPSEIPLCGVLSGCLCDDEIMNSSGLINITGLNNSWQYSNYEWFFNGNSFNPSQNASSLIIDPLDANFLTICSGSITLEVTDNNGCLSVSNPLYIEPNCNSCFSTNTDYNISQTICASESFVFGANTYSAPGIFSSNFQSINGCDSNVVLDLTVLPLQTSFQNIIICEGDSVVIGTSIYYQNGIYTDTFNVDAGCDSIQITEIIISDPIANLSFSESLLNAFVIGGTPPYYFESGNQNGIIFTSTNNFGTPVSINPINNGMYYFFIIDANNCISDTVFYQVDIASSSFSDFQINNLFIYPNPSSDIFNITFNSETIQDLSIRILNVVGAEVYRENRQEFVGEYIKQISLDKYGKGIYFLEIETNTGVINKKIILQ